MVEMNLGNVLKGRGQLRAAEQVFKQNFDTKTRVLGQQHLDTCYAALNLVGVWTDAPASWGKYSEARQMVEGALRELVQAHGQEHPTSLSARRHLGVVLQLVGEHELVVETLRMVRTSQVPSCLPVCLSACLPVYLSACLSVCLSGWM